ncbi:hypothetical protein [Lichenibacterium dinghuense]|uniref:hypothetical protein n=1 Tax=Lichenibacterium dinghuense TaxID=2895977 RepID=UPI001F36E7B4|nr:hypothetical protein [Lichenibacterium sp. 6Y81]
MAAKPKRPSMIDAMMAPESQPEIAPEAAPAAPRKPKPDVQHTSVYIPRPAHERLREIAFHERVKMHDLIMEGLDLVIEKRGHAERATRSTKEP